MNKLSVIGLGYIGLPTALHAAQHGYDVSGFDIDQEKIKKINAGIPPFYEAGLKEALTSALDAHIFYAATELAPADFFLITVPTPFTKAKTPDLSYVFEATKSIAKVLDAQNVVILESTVPIGATREVCALLEQKTGMRAGIDFYVAHCPERILPGRMFEELMSNDRVIGGINAISSEKAAAFYAPLTQSSLFLTDEKTAEMVKLVENSSRDVAIAFANEMADIARSNNINPHEMIELANKHPRVSILQPGIGVGGHCIAVDPWFLIAPHQEQSNLLKQARRINDLQPKKMFNEIIFLLEDMRQKYPQRTTPIKISILGITYKPDIDDIRESPALDIAKMLSKNAHIDLAICEPNLTKEQVQTLQLPSNVGLWQAISHAEIVVILVPHKEFYALKVTDLNNKQYLDPCGLFFRIKQMEHLAENKALTLYQTPSHSTSKLL